MRVYNRAVVRFCIHPMYFMMYNYYYIHDEVLDWRNQSLPKSVVDSSLVHDGNNGTKQRLVAAQERMMITIFIS